MEVLHTATKGPMLNTLEKFCIYRETNKGNQLNDKNTVTPNAIFDTVLKYNKDTPTTKKRTEAGPSHPPATDRTTRTRNNLPTTNAARLHNKRSPCTNTTGRHNQSSPRKPTKNPPQKEKQERRKTPKKEEEINNK